MIYYNLKHPKQEVSFREATIQGLGKDKGLFFPQRIPTLPKSFIQQLPNLSHHQIANQVLFPFVEGSITKTDLNQIVDQAFNFPFPLVPISDNIFSLELFHGPTMAFKDVGARFMSRCLNLFKGDEQVHVLVATSGDTGSAVANGFYNVEGVEVSILYPKGKVSEFQEYQMASLGKNIHAIAVDGTFDDCQALVKQAFSDEELNRQMQLSSANSINIARLLPQMLYYFLGYKTIRKVYNTPIVMAVPSGNLGNLTAGAIAQKMGLPIDRLVAVNNSNDTFYQFLNSGIYSPKNSKQTLSNAMDVGTPSNFDRLLELYSGEIDKMRASIVAQCYSDQKTLETIQEVYENHGYLLDPHGAVGYAGIKHHLKFNEKGILLETAHPKKFHQVIQQAGIDYPAPVVNSTELQTMTIKNSFDELKQYLSSCLV